LFLELTQGLIGAEEAADVAGVTEADRQRIANELQRRANSRRRSWRSASGG
jgi:hypothetical protein